MDLCILIYVFQSKIMYFKLSESKAPFCKKLEMNAMPMTVIERILGNLSPAPGNNLQKIT